MSPIRNLKGRTAEFVRGALNPLLVRATRKSGYSLDNSLVLTGYPRSGTTWLAELIATVPHTGLLFEPMDFRNLDRAREAGISWDNFRDPSADWPEGELYLREALEGRVLSAWTTSHMSLRQAVGIRRWVVKFVRANPVLGWLVRRFDIPPPVVLVRHPCAVYSSWVSRGWPVLDYPLSPGLRYFDLYPEHREWATALRAPEEIFAAQWCMQHRALFDQMQGRPYYLCAYEKCITDGLEEVQRILDHWGLPRPGNLERSLARPSGKASDTLQANSSAQLGGWQKRLESVTVSRMTTVLERFSIDCYHAGPEPDFRRLDELRGAPATAVPQSQAS